MKLIFGNASRVWRSARSRFSINSECAVRAAGKTLPRLEADSWIDCNHLESLVPSPDGFVRADCSFVSSMLIDQEIEHARNVFPDGSALAERPLFMTAVRGAGFYA
ncbi:MAG: hypothetical protein ACP5FH_04650 [Terracidiphilus sp.]